MLPPESPAFCTECGGWQRGYPHLSYTNPVRLLDEGIEDAAVLKVQKARPRGPSEIVGRLFFRQCAAVRKCWFLVMNQ